MPDPRDTRTNAADAAPGVDDGRAGAPPPRRDSKPGGRPMVFIGLGVVLVILALIFIARPERTSEPDGAAASVRQELEVSQDPQGTGGVATQTPAPTP